MISAGILLLGAAVFLAGVTGIVMVTLFLLPPGGSRRTDVAYALLVVVAALLVAGHVLVLAGRAQEALARPVSGGVLC